MIGGVELYILERFVISIRQRLLLLVTILSAQAFPAWAQSLPEPNLPPAPTPTPLYPSAPTYPGSGMSAAYTTPEGLQLYAGQSLYLPIYARAGRGDSALTVVASIRNTDPRVALEVTSGRYYDGDGKLIRNLIARPLSVPPLATRELAVPRNDAGGTPSGTSLILDWSAERPINPPILEALHSDGNVLRFTTTARAIQAR